MRISMKNLSFAFALAAFAMSLGASAVAAQSGSGPAGIDGRWDASLSHDGTVIPFRLDIAGSGPTLKGIFYDGFKPYDETTSASFQDGKLVLTAEHYLTTITATLSDGQLTGEVVAHSRTAVTTYGFLATRHVEAKAETASVPQIAGSYVIPLDAPSEKGEHAFRFIVEQRGAEVAASILRVDGDTGAYSGSFRDGKWLLSHYDGSRPGVIQLSVNADGTLQIISASDKATYTAYSEQVAQAKGLAQPDNYQTHTTVRDPDAPFTFDFPDVNGKLVSNDDPRFKGKVVLAIVTGTWCPNCHDEAKYLVQLDRKYRARGLAIVALDFEEPGQQGTLQRQKAFVKEYGVHYTYLIAGAPDDLAQKIPQAENLNTWPATFFIGRDGRVKGVHAGFSSPATGEFNKQLQAEFTAKIERLLAERPSAASAAGSGR
jgi:peroxiredoxin